MTLEVFLPSGARFEVLTQEEADYIDLSCANYLLNYTFENPSDVADLDAVVRQEMLCWRWDTWLSREADWTGEPIDIRHYVDASKKISTEVRQLKEQIGIDKKTRDRTTGDGSVPEFIARLLTAARYMGIHRSEQVDLVLELAMQLRALATVYRNCLDGSTEVVTKQGVRRIEDLATEGEATLLSAEAGGGWKTVPVLEFGDAPVTRITMTRRGRTKVVMATENHRWFKRPATRAGSKVSRKRIELRTSELRVGDRLASCSGRFPSRVQPSAYGIAHGITYGDGTRSSKYAGNGASTMLCGEKDAQLLKWFPLSPTREVPGVGIEVANLPRAWKDTPDMNESAGYLAGWLAGYVAADGTVSNGVVSITSHSMDSMRAAEDVAYRLGIPHTGVHAHEGPAGFSPDRTSTSYRLSFTKGRFPVDLLLIEDHRRKVGAPIDRTEVALDWTIVDIQREVDVAPTYCPVGIGSFVLADHLVTGNSDEEERRMMRCSAEDIIEWILEVFDPEMQRHDEWFQNNVQRLWVGQL